MGMNDRDYSQQAGEPKTQMRSVSIVVKLIAVTVGVYLLQILTSRPDGQDSLAFNWLALERDLVFQSGHVWRFLTYAFCHSEAGLMHIACNMLALYFLGRVVAPILGQREFLWVYLTSAVFAGIIQACAMAIYRTPGQDWVLGASGAVCAVFMLFSLHYPKAKLYLLGIIPIEARWLLLFAITYDGLGFLGLVPAVFVGDGAKIGHAAHLGGLLFGFLYFQWNMNLTSWWDRVAGRTRQAVDNNTGGLKVYDPGAQPALDYSERVDVILAKISRDGEASLTDHERRTLAQASQHLNSTR